LLKTLKQLQCFVFQGESSTSIGAFQIHSGFIMFLRPFFMLLKGALPQEASQLLLQNSSSWKQHFQLV